MKQQTVAELDSLCAHLLPTGDAFSAAVSDRPGLLHCQGAADHREDICERPGGDNCGKINGKFTALLIVLFFSCFLSPWGKTLIIPLSCSISV